MIAKLFLFFNTPETYRWPSSWSPFIAKKIPLFETSLLSIATLLKNNLLFIFELKTVLSSHPAIGKVVLEEGKVLVYLKNPLEASELNRYLFEKNIFLNHLVKRKISLEEQFLELTKNQ